ncbi:rod-determining factor RdfA [Halocatena marina]|uniref:rod-determining factor RdfA n=1 Tax=Halocatena marina TaxID=2934937 RepID=UPI00200EF492|nr:rod-determining factor RdfA [Halocatena marina]
MTKNADSNGGRPPKLRKVIERYHLTDIKSELAQMRQGEDGQSHSLRELANFFNHRVVEAAIKQAGETPLDGEVANYYKLLTEESITKGTRVQAKSKLTQLGVNVEQVEADFVSYQTIRRYLKKHDIEPGQNSKNVQKEPGEHVLKLQSRTVAVAEATLSNLRQQDHLAGDDYDVIVNLSVTCMSCRTTKSFKSMISDGCRCDEE